MTLIPRLRSVKTFCFFCIIDHHLLNVQKNFLFFFELNLNLNKWQNTHLCWNYMMYGMFCSCIVGLAYRDSMLDTSYAFFGLLSCKL
ncbi:hypothetical protein Hanom_Chr10g00899561 [Helianthus anomalus]